MAIGTIAAILCLSTVNFCVSSHLLHKYGVETGGSFCPRGCPLLLQLRKIRQETLCRSGFFPKRYVSFGLFLCWFLIISATCIQAEEITLDASWQFSSTHPGDTEAINGFNQRYGLQWNPRVTRAILLDTNFNFSKNVTTGNIIRQTLSPTGSLQVQNDLFFAEVSGLINQTKNSQSHDQLDRSWETILSSNWDYDFWPTLSASFGQNWLNDNEVVHITNTSQQWYEFIAQWESDTIESYYSYYTQLREDFVENISYDERKHFGRIDYGDSFFSDSLSVNFSGQLTNSITDINGSAETTDGDISIRIAVSQALAGVDPLPTSGGLPGAPALINGDKNSVAFAINLHEVANLGVKADMQAVDTIYVYTGQIDPVLINETGSLRWDLYSSDDGVNWGLERSNPATSYNQDKFRFQIAVGSLERIYLKLVVTAWPASLSIPVTEVEAYGSRGASGNAGSEFTESQEYTRTLLDTNFRYTPTTNTSLNYSIVWDDSDSYSGNDRRRLFQTGSVNWRYSQYFYPSVTVNYTSTTNSSIADTSQRSYALNVQSIFLPTLDTSFGITRNENFTDDILLTTSDSIHVNMNAALYPDLDTTLELNINFNQNEELDLSSESLGLRWTFTARLRPTLLVDFIAEHGTSGVGFSEFVDSQEAGGRATLNMNWRPSDLVSIMANASKGYGEAWSNYESFLLNSDFSVLRTPKTTVIVGYHINSKEDDFSQGFNANWNWNLSEFFTMQSIASYSINENTNSWFINARLTTRF